MILATNLSDGKHEPELLKKVGEFCRYYKVKSRNRMAGKCNMVVEVRTAKGTKWYRRLRRWAGVESVPLVSHDGEVTF